MTRDGEVAADCADNPGQQEQCCYSHLVLSPAGEVPSSRGSIAVPMCNFVGRRENFKLALADAANFLPVQQLMVDNPASHQKRHSSRLYQCFCLHNRGLLMSTATASSIPNANRLLAALPRAEYERLMPYLERVHLPRGRVLFEAGDLIQHAHFPLNGVVSLLGMTEAGETVEVAMVGDEGMLGVSIILRAGVTIHRSMVHIPADALRIRSEVLKMEFDREGKLQDLLLRFTHAFIAQVSQSAICNRFHTVEARLGRWLLVIYDRIRRETFYLTQEFISHMLGTPRTVVTVAANKLQDAGFIRYRRGKITILDRQGLESAACECYHVVTNEISRFVGA